ncbi:unnamed protein product [Aspergillus oryzae]|nr:unnamed protein product [Aspergillus oryzae]
MTGLTSSCNQRENEGILHLSPSLTNCFAARVALALKLLLPPPTMMRWAIRIEGSQTLAGVWGVTLGFMNGEAERQENKRKAKYKNLTFLYLRMRAILNRLRLERALRHPGSGSMYSTNTTMGLATVQFRVLDTFRWVMGDVALAALISEAKQISPSYSLHRISSIFQCIDGLLSLGDFRCGREAVMVLRTFHIFPTRRGEAQLRLQACEQHDDWFIADQPHLFETFHRHLNMLAFDAEDTARMVRFFDALHINDRLLSTAAICRPRPGLAFTVREDYKSLLLSRAESISRSSSSPREERITEAAQSIVTRDSMPLVGQTSDDAVTLSRTEPSRPSMSRRETRVSMSYKEGFIEQWQQISARSPPHSGDSSPLDPPPIHDSPWRERSTAQSTSASQSSPERRSPVSETYSRCSNVPSGEIAEDQISVIGSWELDHQDGRSIAQVTDSHYQHRAPKSPTTPHIIFCPTMNELPEVDFEGRNIKGRTTLPARLQVLDIGVQTIFIARNSTTLIDYEPAFLGEVFVSEFLRHVLGSAYNLEEHWTSPLRSRRGYAPFTAPNNSPLSSFYIDARAGQAMTDFLITMLVKQAENWKFFPPDYHIDVQTTVDDISASFTWNMFNFDMVGQRSTVKSNVYVWKPLKEPARQIRLLHLLPGTGIEDLRGDLMIAAITDRVKYDAISYTWGSALQPFTLHTTEGNIPITTSLYVALMRMRKHKEAIWLWVDAVCINQKDDIEKAAQISMMPDIFRSATRVYAWIGEEEDGSSEAIQTIKQIAKQRLEPTMPSANRYQDIPPLGRTFWNNLGRLLERKWFRRIWIVQEIVLARDIMVLCGKESVPWGQFCDMVRLCFDYAKQCSSDLVLSRGSSAGSVLRLAKFRKECRENGDFEARYPLLSLFEHFQLTEATRRRDKLFALLNLASDNCEELGPDYKAPLEDIIWRYACTFVKNGHVMELLYRSGRSSDPRFPSWVPDWTSAPYPRTLSKWKCKTKPHRFTAATRFLEGGQLGLEKVLSLRGHLVDRVSRVGVCPSYTSGFPAYLQEISTMVDGYLPKLTREEAAIVKRRLPIGDSDMVPEEERTLCQDRIDYSHHADPNIAGFPGVTQAYIAIASEFADLFSPAVACCTVMGKVGIVPAKTRVGDRIAVFRSGRLLTSAAALSGSVFAQSKDGVEDLDGPGDDLYVKDLSGCPGYKATKHWQTRSGFYADLTLAGPACNVFGTDLPDLKLEVEYQTSDRLHVKILDTNNTVYQVPDSVFPRPGFGEWCSPKDSKLKFDFQADPFSFTVSRTDTGEVLFDTTGNKLVFESQYVYLKTHLPQNPHLYGLGEHSDAFMLNTTNYTRTIYTRDAYGTPQGENLYGAHPIYFDHRQTGTHGVFLLNSNGMDIFIDNNSTQFLEYNIIGGVLDFYFIAGPTPRDVAIQYAEITQTPLMTPYWGLGYHQCKYGYQDVYEVAAVVANYSTNNIPLETIWTDIDYMDRRRIFTIDPERFPADLYKDLVDTIHARDQHYIVMVDPAVYYKESNPALDEGLKYDIFMKENNGSEYQGVVWAGPSHFPDWFHPDSQQYWSEQFLAFFDGTNGPDIDALWIDMNEPANFYNHPYPGNNTTPENFAEVDGDPPAAPAVRDGPDAPIPGFPASLQPNWVQGNATEKRSTAAVVKRQRSQSRRNLGAGHWKSPKGKFDARAGWQHGKQTGSGCGPNECKGLPNRHLIRPPYMIQNGAGPTLADSTADTDLVQSGGYVQYDTHNLYGAMMSSHSHNAMRARRPDDRALVITRSTFAGSGKDVSHWLGVDYIYTAIYKQNQTGTPALNPLFFNYPNDPNTYPIDLQFFYGDGILVSPVTEENSTSVTFYLPDDIFYEWGTGKPVRGQGEYVSLDNIDYTDITIHYKGGIVYPQRIESANTTTALRQKGFNIVVAPGLDGRAEGSLYLDDGVSVVQDTVSEIDFVYENGKLTMTGSFEYEAGVGIETITVLGVESKPEGDDVEYDAENKKLVKHVDVPLTGEDEITIL